jgi:hypothetical protein
VSPWSTLVLVSPAIALIVVAGIVMVIALCRATPSDIPTLASAFCSTFARLGEQVCGHRRQLPAQDAGPADTQEVDR